MDSVQIPKQDFDNLIQLVTQGIYTQLSFAQVAQVLQQAQAKVQPIASAPAAAAETLAPKRNKQKPVVESVPAPNEGNEQSIEESFL